MSQPRPSQFCALARAVDLLGERWTLLVVRELLLGPQRFSDLLARLDGISPSVLTQRLRRLDEMGIIARFRLEPPAASTVYRLTDAGLALEPALLALVRWGGRFLYPHRPGERFDPEWLFFPLKAYARRSASPQGTVLLRVRHKRGEATFQVAGGAAGTVITRGDASADASVRTDVDTLFAILSGAVPLVEATRSERAEAAGPSAILDVLPEYFDLDRPSWDRTSKET